MKEDGLGQVSKSTASRICRELRARYKAFCARSLADVELLALFLDAIYLPLHRWVASASLEHEYPSAAACLAEDLPALCVHLKYLPRQRKRLRSSNLLERSLEEVRRRTKVIGRFPGETSCLSLCWAVLDIFIPGARGLGLSDLEYRQVVQLKIAHAQRDELVIQKTA
jgi:transposase-like protein